MEITMLPEQYLQRMKRMLGDEFEDFTEAYSREPVRSLRANRLKKGQDIRNFFELTPLSWCEAAYYYKEESFPGKHPLHEAGAYYIQEASAMLPAGLLDIQGDLRVLDLCAAPGGKSTQIAAAMSGRGLLVSNEIIPKRAKVLSSNIERMGVSNAVVTNEAPDDLAARLPGFFDRILVDAPCSGEGMFRKNPEAIAEWREENIRVNAERQLDILDRADFMLSDGGRLVYSTCTFSPEEDEEVVIRFLQSHPWYELVEVPVHSGIEHGRSEWTETGDERVSRTLRIFPHRAGGEGHFAAVFQKNGEQARRSAGGSTAAFRKLPKGLRKEFDSFAGEVFKTRPEFEELLLFGDTLCAVPGDMIPLRGLKAERVGLELGKLKSGRFMPAHAWAMAAEPGTLRSYEVRDIGEAAAYIRGEALRAEAERGYLAVTFAGYTLGWGKSDGRMIKNHYPKGLRKSL